LKILAEAFLGELSLDVGVELRALLGETNLPEPSDLLVYRFLNGLTSVAVDALGHEVIEVTDGLLGQRDGDLRFPHIGYDDTSYQSRDQAQGQILAGHSLNDESIGGFSSYGPKQCSTGGLEQAMITPVDPDGVEGSHGWNSNGEFRAPLPTEALVEGTSSTCFQRSIGCDE